MHGKCDYLKEERRDSFLQLFVAGLNIPLTRNVVVGGLVFYGGGHRAARCNSLPLIAFITARLPFREGAGHSLDPLAG